MNQEESRESQRKRFQFLSRLFEAAKRDENTMVRAFELGTEIGFSHEETKRIADYLVGEGLMKWQAIGGWASITHQGIVKIEALSESDKSTEARTMTAKAGGTGLSGRSEQVFIRLAGGTNVITPFPSSVYIEKIESIQNILLAELQAE